MPSTIQPSSHASDNFVAAHHHHHHRQRLRPLAFPPSSLQPPACVSLAPPEASSLSRVTIHQPVRRVPRCNRLSIANSPDNRSSFSVTAPSLRRHGGAAISPTPAVPFCHGAIFSACHHLHLRLTRLSLRYRPPCLTNRVDRSWSRACHIVSHSACKAGVCVVAALNSWHAQYCCQHTTSARSAIRQNIRFALECSCLEPVGPSTLGKHATSCYIELAREPGLGITLISAMHCNFLLCDHMPAASANQSCSTCIIALYIIAAGQWQLRFPSKALYNCQSHSDLT